MSLQNLKIAIVCDWLTTLGGAERIIQGLHRLFPDAPIYTALFDKNIPGFEHARIIPSFLQKIPFARKHHQWFLSLMPIAFEQFDLSDFDIVISSSHSCAKGIITKPKTMHICYCHSPMRYVWDNCHRYVEEYRLNPIIKKFVPKMLHKIRLWDRLAAQRVDYFIANSKHVKKRIQKYYQRDADVVYPFVDIKKFHLGKKIDSYYLAVGRLTSYKKFDLLIDTFNELCLPLKIVGTGVEKEKLEKKANANIEFLGRVDDQELANLYAESRALLFPQNEDFGIAPLESFASGRPVIAFRDGGALETIIEGETGLFFDEQNIISLKSAVQKFERTIDQFDPLTIQKHAQKFSYDVFCKNILDVVDRRFKEWGKNML